MSAALTRRGLVGAGAALLASPAGAAPAADPGAWLAYEGRLQARLRDGGGGRFDLPAAREILALTNAVRRAEGAGSLRWHEELALTARAHAADLAARSYVEHLSPEGFDPSHRFWLLDRRTIGSPSENIAYRRGEDAPEPSRLLQIWRRSPSHWRNLLRRSHTDAGFGLVRLGQRHYLVGLYASPLKRLPDAVPLRPSRAERLRLEAMSDILISPPQGLDRGARQGVWQITASQRIDDRTYNLIGGPVFVAA